MSWSRGLAVMTRACRSSVSDRLPRQSSSSSSLFLALRSAGASRKVTRATKPKTIAHVRITGQFESPTSSRRSAIDPFLSRHSAMDLEGTPVLSLPAIRRDFSSGLGGCPVLLVLQSAHLHSFGCQYQRTRENVMAVRWRFPGTLRTFAAIYRRAPARSSRAEILARLSRCSWG